MPDRRNAPVFAAAAAFVLVLVFGKLIDSPSSTPSPNPSGSLKPTATSSSPSPSPKASSTGGHVATPTTPPALIPLTVEVTELASAAAGPPVLSISGKVLSEERNATAVASGTLSPEGETGTNFLWTPSPRLAAGSYQVCLQPPTGTTFVGHNTGALPGWFCTKVPLAPDSLPVMFTLARATP
jgi:hypothetical protein